MSCAAGPWNRDLKEEFFCVLRLSCELLKLQAVHFLLYLRVYQPCEHCVLQAAGELPAKDLTLHPLPPKPSPPVRPPGQGFGVMEPGVGFTEAVPEPGWIVSRLANGGTFKPPLRSMLPASSFEKWEDIVAKVDSKNEVDAAGMWMDCQNPSIGVSGSVTVEYFNPEEAGENANVVCKLFKPPPGSSDPLDPNDVCQV